MAGLRHKIRIVNKTGLARDTEFFTQDGEQITGIRALAMPRVGHDDLLTVDVELIAELDLEVFLGQIEQAKPINPQGEKKDA